MICPLCQIEHRLCRAIRSQRLWSRVLLQLDRSMVMVFFHLDKKYVNHDGVDGSGFGHTVSPTSLCGQYSVIPERQYTLGTLYLIDM